VTLKGHGHDPKIFGGYYLETSGDTASVTTEARLRKLYVSAKNADEGKKNSLQRSKYVTGADVDRVT